MYKLKNMDITIFTKQIEKAILDFHKKYDGMSDVIFPVLENYNLESKEELEICQIGKFVYLLDAGIKIVDKPKPPAPDFIIECNSLKIGLEHTRILSENSGKVLKIDNLVKYSADIFKNKYPGYMVSATIQFKDDLFEFKQKDKKDLANLISDIVYYKLVCDYVEYPSFISDIKIRKHSLVTFNYHEIKWQPKPLSRSRLESEVHKKELKIQNYKMSDYQFDELWLVLLIGSLSSTSYEIDEFVDYKIPSMFDRVFLMSDFEGKIIQIK